MENVRITESNETLDDHAFIELVKDFIGSANVLPIMNLLHEGNNSLNKISTEIDHCPVDELTACIDKMIRFAIVQPMSRNSDGEGPCWFLTPVGQEFRLILLDIERLKLKYRE